MVEQSTRLTSAGTARRTMQRFGGFLAGMVIPNIAAFIAWGLITALFIPTGWTPNAHIATMVGPLITFLLPLLIGYSGGKLVYDHRGGVVGAIATAGVAVGSPVPMFIGAMIAGPLGGYVIKKFDQLVEDRVPTGFEMLINNFSAGILGGALSLLGFLVIGPVMTSVSGALGAAATWVTAKHMLPLIAIFIEPGKVLFLNNAINHGILAPLGIQQAKAVGKSIFFLLETDPGPGLGILLAYWLFGKGAARQSAPSAIVIQFLGGIHEIYFPYVLMRPLLILAAIGGGLAADTTFMVLHAGLVATPSPGSIFAEILMTPKGGLFPVLFGILVGTVVSFAIASVIVRRTNTEVMGDDSFDMAKSMVQTLKQQSKGVSTPAASAGSAASASAVKATAAALAPGASASPSTSASSAPTGSSAGQSSGLTELPEHIVVACEAGMGSSAMGASILKKKLKEAGYQLSVQHVSVNQIPKHTQIVFTQSSLADRARQVVPNSKIYVIENFLEKTTYDKFIHDLQEIKK